MPIIASKIFMYRIALTVGIFLLLTYIIIHVWCQPKVNIIHQQEIKNCITKNVKTDVFISVRSMAMYRANLVML